MGHGLKALLAWSPLMVTSLHSFTSTLALNDPLQTLFQLMSGRIPQAATVPFTTPASRGFRGWGCSGTGMALKIKKQDNCLLITCHVLSTLMCIMPFHVWR